MLKWLITGLFPSGGRTAGGEVRNAKEFAVMLRKTADILERSTEEPLSFAFSLNAEDSPLPAVPIDPAPPLSNPNLSPEAKRLIANARGRAAQGKTALDDAETVQIVQVQGNDGLAPQIGHGPSISHNIFGQNSGDEAEQL